MTLAIITVGYKLLFVKNKEQFKKYIKIVLIRIIGIFIPVVILFIYLICNNALTDFINYAVLGIKTFSNKISYVTLFLSDKIEIRILSVLMPFSIILMIWAIIKILKNESEEKSKLITMLTYSFAIIIVMYPISDVIHFLIGSYISIIGFLYLLSILGKFDYESKKYKLITDLVCIFLFAVVLEVGLTNIYTYLKAEKNTSIEHYKNIEISDGLSKQIDTIDNFIFEKDQEGKKVYILDAEAAIYMIPINKYNKDYDMFLKGNIGKDGEQGQIEKIKNRSENELFLIRKPNLRTNWQTPLNVINYVRENLEKKEEISIYEVYK